MPQRPRRGRGAQDAAEMERRLQGIVASAMDAIVTVDHQQRIILFNPAAERMFGVDAKMALGEHISTFIPERFRAAHAHHIRHFTQTGATNRAMGSLGAISGLRADGHEFPIEASISQVEVGGERLATVILRDITERKAMEESRDLLAREIDHRAKNALAVVQALVSLTRASTTTDFIAAIKGRVGSLGRSHSLLAQNRWEGAELAQLIEDECAAYHRPGQVRVECQSIVLAARAVQPIGLLIHELATNAVKYGSLSAENGHVDIQADLQPTGVAIIWREFGGPPARAPTVRGFGSTLMSEVVVRQLGGVLNADWSNSGLTLTATLPYDCFRSDTHTAARPAPEVSYGSGPVVAGDRLLIVEDESLLALEMAQHMQGYGWQVVGPALSLEEAFDLMAAGEPPDVAMLDINLRGQPVYPLAEALQQSGVPFVFCTGYESPEHPERFGASPVLRKPVNIGQLAGELHRIRRPH